jgi:hypothetical protein
MASTFPPPEPLPLLARLRRGPSLCSDRPKWVERRPSRLAEKADRVEWRAANNILTVWSISREFSARTLTVAAREQRGFL